MQTRDRPKLWIWKEKLIMSIGQRNGISKSTNARLPKRAKEIILTALGKKDVRDREDVLMRAAEIYEASGEKERAKELEKQTKLLNKQSSMVIKPAKIGRNDPCPCGSDKKYKKCCGAN